MPKKLILITLLLASFVLICSTPAYCDDALKKLGRGLSNVVMCPFEILLQIARVNNSDGPMAAASYGVLKGVGMTGLRALVGVYEVATFPIPLPKYYKPILTDPEFFFEEMNW